MRILLANTGHPATIKGGAEAAVLDLAHALVGRGHEVALAVHHAGNSLEERCENGVRVYGLPNRNLYFGFDGERHSAAARLAWHALDSANPFMASAFGAVLDRERPDVLNTHVLAGLSPLIWREAARRNVPIVHYLHEYGALCPRGSTFRDGHLCASPCAGCLPFGLPRRRLSRLVDGVAGVSRFTLERHLDWGLFPNAAACVLPNVFHGLGFAGRHVVPDAPLRIGYFGRLIPDKGAHLLIEAASRLPPDGWTLDIAGTGDPGYVLDLKASAGPNVRFLGWAKAETFFPDIDLLVLPSLWPDPQPRVTFEAFSHGVPVVGARAGGIPEEIDDGETGWLFEAGSAGDLSRVLAARLADRADRELPARHFGERLARLDPHRVIRDYERVYEGAIERARSGPAEMQFAAS